MNTYQNILIALDLTQSAEEVLKKAMSVSDNDSVNYTVIHVVDYLPYMGFGEGTLITPTYTIPNEELISNARQPIEKLLNKVKLFDLEPVIEIGNATSEIVKYAEENAIELIVVGSHGRHGVKLLLGSTANGILHHAPCDVLAVRIYD